MMMRLICFCSDTGETVWDWVQSRPEQCHNLWSGDAVLQQHHLGIDQLIRPESWPGVVRLCKMRAGMYLSMWETVSSGGGNQRWKTIYFCPYVGVWLGKNWSNSLEVFVWLEISRPLCPIAVTNWNREIIFFSWTKSMKYLLEYIDLRTVCSAISDCGRWLVGLGLLNSYRTITTCGYWKSWRQSRELEF